MIERKPDPDQILQSIRIADERASKGNLKVFLGMCAGSGKTYAMLKAAHQLKAEGVDVVIGYVETHGRIETERLIEGLESIPCLTREYKSINVIEMDLDAIVSRKPQLVLVDELAHTNIAGSRHVKRYQDIEELLGLGIGVLTTLNVQHLESRSETVEEITGVRIHEKVPDSFLQYADIELVDTTPDTLLKRLSEGKVYVPDAAAYATSHFFRKGNLHALREMALRFTAERVDIDMIEYMRAKNIQSTWKSTEKLMVAVGPSPTSRKLIRWTRRMAYNLGAQWIAVSIDLGEDLLPKVREQITKNQELARELGAKVIQITDNDVVFGLLKVAFQYNVTQIVIGKTNEHPLRNFLNGGSIVDRLLKNSDNIDIYVVKADADQRSPHLFRGSHSQTVPLKEWFISTIVMLGLALVCYPVRHYIGYQTVGLVFLLGISGLSMAVGRIPVFYAALLGSLVWDFFFISPQFTFHIDSIHDAIALIANFFVALTGGTLFGRLRKNQTRLRKSQEKLTILFSMLESLNNASSIKEVVRMTRKELKKHFEGEAIVYLKNRADSIQKLDPKGFGNVRFFSEKEFAVASWAFEHQSQAGKDTQTLPDSYLHYYPLVSRAGVIGVIGIRFEQSSGKPLDRQILLRSFISQVTASLEREIIIDKVKRKQIEEESQKLFQTVLNSLSHELRTPISIITTAVSNLNDEKTASNLLFRKQIGEGLNAAAIRLDALVENILDMSRVESGYLTLTLRDYDVSDLIGTVLNETDNTSHAQSIKLNIQEDLPPVRIDISWLKQALVNLIRNAFYYTPADTVIEICAGMTDDMRIFIDISDNGPGVPESSLNRLFDKFYRVPGSKSGGVGLGLTVSKAIIEAHKGTISACNQPEGGLSFRILLNTYSDGQTKATTTDY